VTLVAHPLADAFLAERAERIRTLGKRVISDVIEIGRLLIECRERLKEENRWRAWLEEELGWSHQTAGRFIQLHELSLRRSNLDHLELPISGLYLLAAPSTPEAAREEIITRAESGERLKHAEVQSIIATHSPAAVPRAAKVIEKAAIEENRARREAARQNIMPLPDGMELRIGDFRKVLADVADNSVSLILTDPPYKAEAERLYHWLADFAARVLIPGGSLVVYTGGALHDRDVAIFSSRLRFWWLLAMPHDQSQRFPGKFVIADFKPVLWYVKEFRRGKEMMSATLHVLEPADKTEHDWGQSEGGVTQIIETLTLPGEKIIDPFAGTAKWGRIAAQMGRPWLGADIVEGGSTIIKADELPVEPAYDAADDFAKSLEVGYAAIRERVAAGGPGWTPREPQPPAAEPAAPDGDEDPLAIPDFLLRRAPL
jgi:hypothetical protein